MTNHDCIFCKIIQGDIPSFKIYEDASTFAFLDIHPVNAGHTLVIPKNHSQNIFDIDASDWTATLETVRVVSAALERALGADGINLEMNNREHAGQLVDHTHVHIIPRFKNDGLKHWAQGTYRESEAEETLKKIKGALSH